MPSEVVDFADQHCVKCHDDVELEADLDLWTLSEKPISGDSLSTWIKVYDRVNVGEMPPQKKKRPEERSRLEFLEMLSASIEDYERPLIERDGRALARRLNRYEYENALRDLFDLPNLAIRDTLPEDPSIYGFNKSGESLDVSHVQVSRYLQVAEQAIREAIAPRVEKPELRKEKFYTWHQRSFVQPSNPIMRKSFPVVDYEIQQDLMTWRGPVGDPLFVRPNPKAASLPERWEREATVMLVSTYEPADLRFNEFKAPESGMYRLSLSGYTVWMSNDFKSLSKGRRSEPVTVYGHTSPRILRRVGAFDFSSDAGVREMTVWLRKGETVYLDAARLVRLRPPEFKNPLKEEDGMPGVAFKWLEVEGPLIDTWPGNGHTLVFGDLPIEDEDGQHVMAKPTAPVVDARTLLRSFMEKAYRRPVVEEDVDRFHGLVLRSMDAGFSFTDSMVAGYTAVLSSPGFLYLDASPGRLGGAALAERLSLFLWNSIPDDRLMQLAESGALVEVSVLSSEVDRLLDDPRSRRFVDSFLDYWLDLRYLKANSPDAELYPEYQLDDQLTESLPLETQLFFSELIRGDLGVGHIVASDFTYLNERLALLYEIEGVVGTEMRRVELDTNSPRGGFLTQGSVLKLTANGTSTSPVTRGVWIMERILGWHSPPPPPTVVAIESDIRGATTVREQLERHRSQESCNTCHVKIDPAGFALENFDVMGAWRDRYRSTAKGVGEAISGIGHHGQSFRYLKSQPVAAEGQLPDGRAFSDIRELKRLLVEDKELLARNLAEQFAVYATGGGIRFSDRDDIQEILSQARKSDYGVRSLIHAVVQSELFLNK